MSSDYIGKSGSSRRPRRRLRRQPGPLEQVTEIIQTSAQASVSPRWSSTTKLLVGLVIVGIIAFLFFRFTSLITPLMMVFILAYLLHPVTILISHGLRISWKASVNILYLVILVLLIGLLTLGGFGLVTQVQSLIRQIQTIVADLPNYVQNLSGQVSQFGPLTPYMRTLDLNAVSQQLLSFIQPLLGRTGALVGTLASGAAEIFGWTFFVLIVIYIFILSLLGVRYAIGIAIMAGLAKFLPYIGPGITWVVLALVTYFQPDKPFHLQPLSYVGIVVVTLAVVDWIIDNLIAPRIMARSLRVHPAAVLVTALIAANLLGILGVVIAAPFLASITLLGRYTMRKMLDLDPWPGGEAVPSHPLTFEWITRIRVFIVSKFQRNILREKIYPKESSDE